jgi:tellurite resistance protein
MDRSMPDTQAAALPPVVDAIITAAALVAVADGQGQSRVSRAEASACLQDVRQLAELDRAGMVEADRRLRALRREFDHAPEAQASALARLAAIKLSRGTARLVLDLARRISGVDGAVSEPEAEMVRRIAEALRVRA